MRRNATYHFPFARYPAIRVAVLLACGIVAGAAANPGNITLLIIFSAMALGVYLAENVLKKRNVVYAGRLSALLYLALIFLFGALLYHHHQERNSIPQPLAQKLNLLAWERVPFSGKIEDAGINASGNKTYRLLVTELMLTDGATIKQPFYVRGYSGEELNTPLHPGNNVKGELYLYEFPEQRNPQEFDYGRWLKKNGFAAHGRVEQIHENDLSTGNGWQKLRNYALKNIENRFSGQVAPLAKALILGYKSDLAPDTRNEFSRSGLAHIMAVSGLHVGFVAAPFWLIIPWLWQRKYGKITGLIFVTGMLVFYAGLTGFSPSVCRASLMIWFFVYGRLYQKLNDSINLAGVAAIILLIIDPSSLFEVGFQLSFAAVFTILLLVPKIQNVMPGTVRFGWKGTVVSILTISVVVQMGLFPILVHYFGEFSITGPLANVLVLPLLSVAVPAGLMIAMIGNGFPGNIAGLLARPIEWIIMWIEHVARWFGSGTYSYLSIEAVPLSMFPLWILLIGFFAALPVSKIRWKMLAGVCLLLNVAAAEMFINKLNAGYGKLEVTYLDVGQADAIHIKTPAGKHLLIDAGRWSPMSNSGEQVILPYLKAKNIDKLDAVILSHAHADHIGGMPSIIEHINIKNVFKSNGTHNSGLFKNVQAGLRKKEIPVEYMHAGKMIEIDPSIKIFVLGPENDVYDANPNNHSVALKIVYGETSFLFTGDAEEKQERQMAEKYQDFLKSDVYKVGHHGSNTSSTREFLHYVDPEISVASLAFRNWFGHPGSDTVSRIGELETRQLFTSLEGAVILQSDGKEITRVLWK